MLNPQPRPFKVRPNGNIKSCDGPGKKSFDNRTDSCDKVLHVLNLNRQKSILKSQENKTPPYKVSGKEAGVVSAGVISKR